jgi:hypothetical protein
LLPYCVDGTPSDKKASAPAFAAALLALLAAPLALLLC